MASYQLSPQHQYAPEVPLPSRSHAREVARLTNQQALAWQHEQFRANVFQARTATVMATSSAVNTWLGMQSHVVSQMVNENPLIAELQLLNLRGAVSAINATYAAYLGAR